MKVFGKPRKYYTVQQAEEILSLSHQRIYQKISDGTFRTASGRRRGRRRTLLFAEDVDAYNDIKLEIENEN